MPRPRHPGQAPRAERPPIAQSRRLALIHQFLTNQRIEPCAPGLPGCLLLLYAQPVTRLSQLTLDDIVTGGDGQVLHPARRARPPPVPEPFAAMLTELAANRANMNTAVNPGCQWLFPGQRARGCP